MFSPRPVSSYKFLTTSSPDSWQFCRMLQRTSACHPTGPSEEAVLWPLAPVTVSRDRVIKSYQSLKVVAAVPWPTREPHLSFTGLLLEYIFHWSIGRNFPRRQTELPCTLCSQLWTSFSIFRTALILRAIGVFIILLLLLFYFYFGWRDSSISRVTALEAHGPEIDP